LEAIERDLADVVPLWGDDDSPLGLTLHEIAESLGTTNALSGSRPRMGPMGRERTDRVQSWMKNARDDASSLQLFNFDELGVRGERDERSIVR